MNDRAALEEFLKQRLLRPLPGAPAHWRMAPQPARGGWEPDKPPATARQAAALILIYPKDDRLWIPLTVRHADLPQHPGQVSLPGGRVDAGEAPAHAAMRETHEEIGVDAARVRVVGALSPLWVIVSNFVVYPFVAVADERPAFRAAAREVEEILEVPLDDLRDRARLKWTRRTRGTEAVHYPYFDVAGREVWGATAMMLGELMSLFADEFGPGPPPAW